MHAPGFVVDEVFTVPGQPGPLVVGRAEDAVEIVGGADLHLDDERGRATVRVVAVEFATPRAVAEGRMTLVLASDLDGRVHTGSRLLVSG